MESLRVSVVQPETWVGTTHTYLHRDVARVGIHKNCTAQGQGPEKGHQIPSAEAESTGSNAT